MCNLSSTAHTCMTSGTVSPRPALRKTRNSLRLDRGVKFNIKDDSPSVTSFTNPVRDDRIEGNLNDLEAGSLLYYSEEKIHLKL